MPCFEGVHVMKRSFVAVLSLLSILPFHLLGQEFRSTISGVVKDSSGSAVPNAPVVATETRTGTKTQSVSDSDGNYTIPFLLPGTYAVTAEVPGFKKFERQGLDITSGAHPIVDISLQVGNSTETVNVVGDVPLVDTANASAEQIITIKQVEDLPVNGRTPLMLAQLAIGVLPEGSPSLVHPFDNGGAADFSLGGSPIQSSELLLDGSPDATWDGRVAYNPPMPMDAVQEVRVDAFDSDAAVRPLTRRNC